MALHVIKEITNPVDAPEKENLHWLNTSTKESWYSIGTDNLDDWVQLATMADLTASTEVVTFTAKVSEAAGVSKGQAVYISGVSGGNMTVSLADKTDFVKADLIAISTETKSNNSDMSCQNFGLLENLDTSAFSSGDILYLGSNGDLTNVNPVGIEAVMRIGYVIKSNVSTGSIFIDISHLTVVDSTNSTLRSQLVNINTGTASATAFTLVNDANHRAAISLTGENFTGFEEVFGLYTEGYGNMRYHLDGNHDHEFITDVTDSHNFSATVKAKITAAGEFHVDTIKAITPNSDLTIPVNGTGNIVIGGRNIVDDGAKLDGIESGATADQTDVEIKTAYENNANTNAFTDAEKTNLSNQSGTNTGDQLPTVSVVTGTDIDASILYASGGCYKKTLAGNVVMTISNPTEGQCLLFDCFNAGPYTITWAASGTTIKWPDDIEPIVGGLYTGMFTFVYIDGKWRGTAITTYITF